LRCHKSLDDNKYSIAIVGDGIAGLVAGWLLKDAGLAARILKRVTESMGNPAELQAKNLSNDFRRISFLDYLGMARIEVNSTI
jgi:2-polyprenyl-6-methoxyphenol hydroxylase-like FAD-dependent oxidoreductase